MPSPMQAESLGEAVRAALRLERQLDLATDPGHGISQLEMIAWTSISTAKSDPAPGLMVIHSLHELLARWADAEPGEVDGPIVPVVYTDTVPARLLHAVESLAVVSTESMQHQTFAEILHALAVVFGRLPPDLQARTEDLILRIISGLGDHILTARLDRELSALATGFSGAGRVDMAASVIAARDALALSVGTINSRATRLSAAKAAPPAEHEDK